MIFGNCAECSAQTQADCPSHLPTYCSNSCAGKAKWRKRPRAKTVTRVCLHCGKEFELKEFVLRSREKNGSKVQYCSRTCSGLAHRSRLTVKCLSCRTVFEAVQSRTDRKFCCDECRRNYIRKNGTRSRTGQWTENGYRVLYVGDGKGKKEHIKIMEGHIGRPLKPNEIVHHINGNRLDNRLENLQLMTRGEHSRLHRLEEKAQGKAFGRYFTGPRKNRNGMPQ